MSATSTAVAGGYGGHCCVCARACLHTTPPSYCIEHARGRYNVQISTSSDWPVGPTPHADCGAQCACYWRGRRDEAKA